MTISLRTAARFLVAIQMCAAGIVANAEPAPPAQDAATEVGRRAADTILDSLEKLQANPAELQAVLSALGGRIEAAKQPAGAASPAAAPLQSEVEGLKAKLAELSRQIESLEAELEKTRKQLPAKATPASAPVAPIQIKPVASGPVIDFNHEIRPILAENCYSCHGPDGTHRKANLRLDDGTGVYEALKSGHIPVVKGDRGKSELFRRVTTADAAERMPPADSKKSLKPEQIELIGRWIDQGGEWKKHWSFIKPESPAVPQVKKTEWAQNPIDAFILARLEKEGLEPSPEADRRTLIRRVTFDLTGLPPERGEVEAFIKDESPKAYETLVDRLLESPRYGEHMARYWLDAARYADTNGFHIDNERFMWPWRDWAINAFNHNLPFDQFTIDQLAGDLLPKPTQEQLVASGFNRNHMINFEGGAIPEEYRTQYVLDRVSTTGTVWMGLTVSCAQCHDHKFDPVSQKEFYQLFAFFNRLPEEGLDGREGNAVPLIKIPSDEQSKKLAGIEERLKAAKAAMEAPMALVDAGQALWERKLSETLPGRWKKLDPSEFKSTGGATLKKLEDGSILAEGANPDKDVYEIASKIDQPGVTAIRLEAMTHESFGGATGRSDNGNFVLGEIEAEVSPPANPETKEKVSFSIASADYSQKDYQIGKAIDGSPDSGWAVDGNTKKENRSAVFVASGPFGYAGGSVLRVRLRFETAAARHSIGHFRLWVTSDPAMAPAKIGPWYASGPYPAADGKTAYETAFAPEKKVDLTEKDEDGRLKWIGSPEFADGKANELKGDVAATYLYRKIDSPSERRMSLAVGSNDAVKVWLNGEVVHDKNVPRPLKEGEDKFSIELKAGENQLLMKVVNYGAAYAFSFKKTDEKFGGLPLDIEQVLLVEKGKRSEAQKSALLAYYRREYSPRWRELNDEVTGLKKEKTDLDKAIPTTMVMRDGEKPRDTFVLVRGQYDQFGDKVEAATPAALPPLPEGASRDRMGLAKWIVDPANPLTARVTVNRFWQQFFGIGIVKTAEDFGTQGEWPTHPELLDWLATDFPEHGWDVKRLVRMIVTSATYRQTSNYRPEVMAKDPENRLLAHAPRLRLEAEAVRDNALKIGGLLVEKIGGPSVRPYQPAGLWEAVAYGAEFSAQRYTQDKGDALYRRSMYTFWKRQSPPPTMLIFDAPNRETCTVRRSRTNTPLQALALLNDPQFVEASRALAQRTMKECPGGEDARVDYAFELATARPPKEAERAILLDAYRHGLGGFKSDVEGAKKLLAVGESKYDEALDPCELAAWTTVANMILNLDETITKG